MKAETPEKLLRALTEILDRFGIDYFITGGFAVAVWGRPRTTLDIDVVVKMLEPQVYSLAKALRSLSKAGYISEEAAKDAVAQKGEFNFIHPESGLKVDFWVQRDDLFSRQEFKRRKLKKVAGRKIYFISPEDLILRKLLWYRESFSSRHLEDAESIVKISGKALDKKYLRKLAKSLGVEGLLGRAGDK